MKKEHRLEGLILFCLIWFSAIIGTTCGIVIANHRDAKYFTISPQYQNEECVATMFDGDDAQIVCIISASDFK